MRISDWSSDVCSSDLDRQPLDAIPLGAALGDIGDAAVEEGRFARQARIDGVGAFMRGAAPVGGLDFEPLAHQLAAERGVVKIAADDQTAVRPGIDEAVRSEEHTCELQSLMRN